MIIKVKTAEEYNIAVEKGSLCKLNEFFDLNRKTLVVTDSGVPGKYAETVLKQCVEGYLFVLPEGESGKSFSEFEKVISFMLEKGFTRSDCIMAVGGGVVGDLSGFAASCYMRGIDFYNCPTTLLSMIDSSIGGKTAVNINGVKNVAGTFYQPKAVVIDETALETLPERELACGFAEAIKMSLTFDKQLFSIFESGNLKDRTEEIIIRSLNVKKSVVEQDEKEKGLRRVLNFGHTLGHAIEAASTLNHGECVALGMIPMCEESVRERLLKVLKSVNLPTDAKYDRNKAVLALSHDKKAKGEKITTVFVPEIGSFEFVEKKVEELRECI